MLTPVEVTAPDGARWMVGRALLPWRPKRRIRGRPSTVDLPSGGVGDFISDDPIGMVLGAIALLLMLVVLVVLLGPAFGVIVFGLEWLIVLLLAIAGIVGRLMFGRPFVVYATSGAQDYRTEIRGWRLSGRIARDLAERITTTGRPPGASPG